MRKSSGGCYTTGRKIKTEGKLMVLYTNAEKFLNKKDELLPLIAGNEPNTYRSRPLQAMSFF